MLPGFSLSSSLLDTARQLLDTSTTADPELLDTLDTNSWGLADAISRGEPERVPVDDDHQITVRQSPNHGPVLVGDAKAPPR